MKLPLDIAFHGMAHSEAVETAVREKVFKLESLGAQITSCRVSVDLLQKHSQQGRPVGVRIDLTIPGRELVVNRVEHEDVYVAIRDAFDDMKRQLDSIAKRRQA